MGRDHLEVSTTSRVRPLRDAIDAMGCLSRFLTSTRGANRGGVLADGSKPLQNRNGGRDHAQRKPWWSHGPQSFSGPAFLDPQSMCARRGRDAPSDVF